MNLPLDYQRRLQREFPDCRMRWSERQECWLLEKRASYARTDINPEKYPKDAVDTFIQRRDGYFLSGEYHAKYLPQIDRLLTYLRSQDPVRMGLNPEKPLEEAARLATAIEAREAEERRRVRQSQTYEGSGVGGELYDRLAWEEGRRVSVPGNYAFGSGPARPEPN